MHLFNCKLSICYCMYVHVCMYVCMYVCRETVEAVPASAPAATATTSCSANISRLLIHSYGDKSISIALGSAAFLSGGVQNRLKKKAA